MLIEALSLSKSYGPLKAVDDVSFSLDSGRTLGIVGESGSGKSTLAKLVAGLIRPDGGQVRFRGPKRNLQVIFQEPAGSLDPRFTIKRILEEPFRIHRDVSPVRCETLLERVGLPASFASRFPRELSGGECQRVALARAVALGPSLVICDEAVSSLDVLVQAQILNLLLDLQKDTGMSYLFITHDLKVAGHMSDDILVMKDGRVCEAGPRDRVLEKPGHPYTAELIRCTI